jgi:hypothetical protein
VAFKLLTNEVVVALYGIDMDVDRDAVVVIPSLIFIRTVVNTIVLIVQSPKLAIGGPIVSVGEATVRYMPHSWSDEIGSRTGVDPVIHALPSRSLNDPRHPRTMNDPIGMSNIFNSQLIQLIFPARFEHDRMLSKSSTIGAHDFEVKFPHGFAIDCHS